MCIGSTPSVPAPPTPPPAAAEPKPTTPVDPNVKRRREDIRQEAALAEGRGSTILTSPLGLTTKASTAPKQLLGA